MREEEGGVGRPPYSCSEDRVVLFKTFDSRAGRHAYQHVADILVVY